MNCRKYLKIYNKSALLINSCNYAQFIWHPSLILRTNKKSNLLNNQGLVNSQFSNLQYLWQMFKRNNKLSHKSLINRIGKSWFNSFWLNINLIVYLNLNNSESLNYKNLKMKRKNCIGSASLFRRGRKMLKNPAFMTFRKRTC